MRRFILALCLMFCFLTIPACNQSGGLVNPKVQKVYHIQDGRYCYHDGVDERWYFLISDQSNHDSPVYYSGTGDPSGYHWETLTPNFNPVFPSFSEIADLDAKKATTDKTIATDSKGLLRTK